MGEKVDYCHDKSKKKENMDGRFLMLVAETNKFQQSEVQIPPRRPHTRARGAAPERLHLIL